MTAPPYMPLYVADYLGDTRHLTTVQHGAYVLLLMAMWRGGGRLPAEPARLARLAGLTPARWGKIAAEVTAFFTLEDGELTQPRLAEDLARYARTVDARRSAGAKGAAATNSRSANAGTKRRQTTGKAQPAAAGKPQAEPRQPEPEPKPEPELKPEPGEGRAGTAPPGRGWDRARLDALAADLRAAAGASLDAASPNLVNLAPMVGLLSPGQGPPADLQGDVLPAIRARAARQRPGSVRHWAYYVPAVLEWRDRRLAGAPPIDPTDPTDDRSRPARSGRAAKRAVWADVLADEAGEAHPPADPPGP